MNREDIQRAIVAMKKHGGSFIATLAVAWTLADPVNKRLIEQTWASDFERYALFDVEGV